MCERTQHQKQLESFLLFELQQMGEGQGEVFDLGWTLFQKAVFLQRDV